MRYPFHIRNSCVKRLPGAGGATRYMRNWNRFLLLFAATLGTLGLLISPPAFRAHAQAQSKLTMTVHAGYGDGGSFIIGEWFPVYVTVDNPVGNPSLRVRVEVQSKGLLNNTVRGVYARDIDLPSPSRKAVTLYAYADDFARSVEVLLLQGSTELSRQTANLNPLESGSAVIIGVASSDPSLLNVLKGEEVGHIEQPARAGSSYTNYLPPRPSQAGGSSQIVATVEHVQLADLPPLSAALDSLGALIVDDVDSGSLSQEQQAAITAWVARGGMLVLAARPGGADALAGFPNLAPVTTGGTRTLSSLDSLAGLVSVPITPTGAIIATQATVKTGAGAMPRVLASQSGLPLVAQREVGKGSVVYLALDPGMAPLKGWDGTVALFKRLLAAHPVRSSFGAQWRNTGYPSLNYYSGNPNAVFDVPSNLFDLPGLDLPDPSLIALFLLVYILVIGPVNFIILRRLKRAELAWITIPALVVLFSVGAYLLAFQSKGGQTVAIRANLMNDVPGAQEVNVTQFFGVFSPFRRAFDLSLNANSAITEVSPDGYGGTTGGGLTVAGGNPTMLDNVNINTWSLRAFMAEHTAVAQSPIESDLRLGDNVIEGTIRNRAAAALQDVVLIRGEVFQYIGYMAPGQRANVKLIVSSQPLRSNTAPADLLPTPPGVTPVQPGAAYLSFPISTGNISAEQRLYNRKVRLLSVALAPLIPSGPPTDMDVLAVAWGPPALTAFNMDGAIVQSEEINLWTSRLPVPAGSASGAGKPKLKSDSVPFTIYAPGNNPSWMAGLPSANLQTTSYSSLGSTTPITNGINLAPYADLTFSLPPGAQPDSLTLDYQLAQFSGQVDVLAYNPTGGGWDRLGNLDNSGQARATLAIPNPASFTDPAGYVTIRLRATSGSPTLDFTTLGLGLNETQ